MIVKIWTIKYHLFIYGIAIGLAHGFHSISKGRTTHQKDAFSRNLTPPKKYAKTIDDQVRQVITKLPSGTTNHDLKSTVRHDGSKLLEMEKNGYRKNSEIVPESGMVVEVFDERKVDGDVLKRGDIMRPEITQGVSGVRRDNLGMTRGNLNKDNSEQSITEVVVDDNDDNDFGSEEDLLGDEESTNSESKSSTNSEISKSNLPASFSIPDFDKNDLEKIRDMIQKEKSNSYNKNHKNTSYVPTNVAKGIENNGTAQFNHSDNNIDDKENMDIRNLDTIAEKYITDDDSHLVTSSGNNEVMINNHNISNKNSSASSTNNNNNHNDSNTNNNINDNYGSNSSNDNDSNTNTYNNNNNITNNNNINDNYGSNSSNDNNASNSNGKENVRTDNINAHNDSDQQVDYSNEIQEMLVNSLGSLESKGKGISDDQLTKIKETVHDFLTKSNAALSTTVSQWSQWSMWSACSATCDEGKRSRTRACGGELSVDKNHCPGSGLQAEPCVSRRCPVDGGYTDWTSWSSCSETCGQQSLQMRMRICMNPRPEYGGKDCPGSRFKIRHCEMPSCQDDSRADESSNRDESKNLDDANVLESLKTILQSKTSSLEETLSNEPVDKASELFDTIYQGGDDTASSNKLENTADDSLTEHDSNTKPPGGNVTSVDELESKISPTDTASVVLNRSANMLADTKLDQSQSIKNAVRTGQADIFGKLNADDSLTESRLRGNDAWKSEGLDRKHAVKDISVKDISVSPLANSSLATKFDSMFVDGNEDAVMETGNERMPSEIHAQNSILNAPSSESEKSRPSSHTINSITSSEEELMNSKSPEDLNSQISNVSSSNVESSALVGTKQKDDHVPGMLFQPAVKDEARDKLVDDHVHLRTASVSVTDNGTSVSSIMGVIRYNEDGKNLPSKISGTKEFRIHDSGEWSSWTTCSSSCGRGYQTRSKQICLQLLGTKENECSHVKVQKKSCTITPCQEIPTEPQTHLVKVEKLQSDEVEGSINRGNVLLAGRIPKVKDAATGREHGTEIMGLVRQELDADFLPWSLWSVCSATCGAGGSRTRERTCQDSKKTNCIGASREKEPCFVKQCSVNGDWSAWSHWTSCSQSCGKSVKLRMRKCDNPTPLYGGEKCSGDAEEEMNCDVPACPANGHWSLWSAWSACPVTCGKALKQRTRSCDNPPPSNGGLTCIGESTEHLNCYLPSCPIDGGFSHWQAWSKCHKSCGENSFRTRFRFCNNPPPADGGKSCHGNRLEVSRCLNEPCTEPINGGFGPWSNWSSCSQDCKPGSIKLRTRMCDDPKPLYGGLDCAGEKTEYRNCSVNECRVDGGLSDWTTWSECSQSCGDTAIRSRERTCTSPPPSEGGRNCSGETFQVKFCEKKSCHQEVVAPTPKAENEQTDPPLVQTIMDEKEQLLTEKKKGNDGVFSELKKKLIANLKKLAPDLGLSLGNGSATANEGGNKAKEVKSKSPGSLTKAVESTKILNDDNEGTNGNFGGKGDLEDAKEQLEDSGDESQDDEVEKSVDPIKSCGINPCLLAKCLSDPFADCTPNTDCDPVYYDSSGNVKKDCNVETTFLTVPASQLCGHDPCQVSVCLKMPMTKCLTSALCKPVYFDETGNVFNCTGVLKTPVGMTCSRDPCIGKLCPIDAQAKCFTDYHCKSTFWNLDVKEEIAECKEPDLEPQEVNEENADQRSQTPLPPNSRSINRLRRPWQRLSKSALEEILKHSHSNGIFVAHAKLKHLRGKNKFSSGHSGLTMTLDEHSDDDRTTDGDTNNSDEHDIHFSKPTKPPYSLSNVLSNKLKQFNNPRKNPILTLTSLNADQYQSQGGNGVGVTKDWKLKLKPPIHLDGYVESPQVYKIDTQKHDKDQSAADFLLRHHDSLSEGLSSQGLNAERLSAERLSSEGLSSEGLTSGRKISDRLSSEGLHTADLTPEKLALEGLRSDEGLNPERLTSEGLHEGNMRFTPAASTLDGIDRLLKSDEAHVGGVDIATARSLTPSPFENVLKQDISDIQSALSNADGQIPGEDKLSGLGSPVIHQGLTASLRSPEIQKENQMNLAGLEAPRGIATQDAITPRVSSPQAIDILSNSQGGQYVPLDSVIDDLRAHVGDNPLNNNMGLL